ncbi:LacI family transcriptional regulator [Streptococcus pneumoniae]|nr:LacI family transcriptional regulator [Streptococcus pneumoniae]
MVTIKDIARVSGVSHGTVSNVLNKKGNVSAAKIKLVEETAKKLGYNMNSQAQFLRKGASSKCFFLLFNNARKKYAEYFAEIDQLSIDVEYVYLHKFSEIKNKISAILSENPQFIVCLGFSPKRFVDIEDNIPIFEVDTYQSNKTLSSFDSDKIFEIVLELVRTEKLSNLYFISLTNEKEHSLFEYLTQKIKNSTHIQVQERLQLLSLYPTLKNFAKYDCIFVDDEDLMHTLLDLFDWFTIIDRPKICLIGSRVWFEKRNLFYIHLDYRILALNTAENLESGNSSIVPVKDGKQILTDQLFDGECDDIYLLTVHSPMNKALEILSEKYKQISGKNIKIIEKRYDELLEMIESGDVSSSFDMIRMDMAWLPTFGKKYFQEITSFRQTKSINQNISKSVSQEYMYIDQKQYTFPLDVSSQILVYRKDLFEDSFLQRRYFEKTKRKLTAPKSYQEFDELSEFFTLTENPFSPTLYGHSLALSSSVRAACEFIPRFRERLAQSRMNLAVLPQVLTEYEKSYQFTEKSFNSSWNDFVTNLNSGKTSMEIIFSNYTSPLFDGLNVSAQFEFATATIPGNTPVIGGGSIGISKYSNRVEECLNFINWLYSEEISILLTSLGGFLPSKYVMQNRMLQFQYPWLSSLEDTFSIGSRTKWYGFNTDFRFEQMLGQELIESVKHRYG